MKRKAGDSVASSTSAASIVKSQRDRYYINSLQQNVHAQRQYGIVGPQNNRRATNRDVPHEDFITMYLIKGSLEELIRATAILLRIMEHVNPHSVDSRFADMTEIQAFDEKCGEMRSFSFKRYYEMIYQWSLDRHSSLSDIKREEEKELLLAENNDNDDVIVLAGVKVPVLSKVHVINLLRACFVIGFIKDFRIRQYVMATHSYHLLYTKTSPPLPGRVTVFTSEALPYIDDFFLNGNNGGEHTIVDMINEVIRIWVKIRHSYHTTQVPLTNIIEDKT